MEARDLVEQMLHPDVRQRITAEQALKHPWFNNAFEDEIQDNIHQMQRIQN